MRWMRTAMAVAIPILLAGVPAAAQTAGPFTGYVVAHVGTATGDDLDENKLTLGASMSVIETGGFGAEFDFGHANGSRVRGDIDTYMVNVTWLLPRGRVRPFVVAGAGALRLRTEVDGWTDWGVNGGGGVHVPVNDVFAVRGDVRYLTTLGDHPDPRRDRGLGFWRIAVGGSLSWTFVD